MRKEMIKPFVWGIVVGAIVLLIVIFSAGWVTTSGSAKAKAEEAVVDRLASICVARFQQDPNRDERLAEFKGKNTWGTDRREYVKTGGWAKMADVEEPGDALCEKCAELLGKLE